MAAFKSFKSSGVLVFTNTSGDWQKLPLAARKLASSKEAGKFIPKLLVTTADGETGIGAVPYEVLKEDARKAAREMRKKVEAFELENQPKAAPLLAEEQEWMNDQGKVIRAAVVKVEAGKVEFLIDQKSVSYPLEKLSEASRNQLIELGK